MDTRVARGDEETTLTPWREAFAPVPELSAEDLATIEREQQHACQVAWAIGAQAWDEYCA